MKSGSAVFESTAAPAGLAEEMWLDGQPDVDTIIDGGDPPPNLPRFSPAGPHGEGKGDCLLGLLSGHLSAWAIAAGECVLECIRTMTHDVRLAYSASFDLQAVRKRLTRLPVEVVQVTTRYLTLVDAAAPGIVDGLYLVGSVALVDFCPNASDIDFIAITHVPVSEHVRRRLAAVHRDLATEIKEPALEGIYVTVDELKRSPLKTTGLRYHDGKLTVQEDGRSPVEWTTLAHHGVTVRGVDSTELDVFVNEAELIEWTLDNLDRYWTRWIAQSKKLTSRTALAMLTDWGVAWGVLGVSRLCYTAATGKIISKTGAGRYALSTFPDRWRRILEEALRCRAPRPTAPAAWQIPWRRRREAVAFMEAAVEECRVHGDARFPAPPAIGGTG